MNKDKLYGACAILALALGIAAHFMIDWHAELHCWREAGFARITPKFFIYQSELDRCMAFNINIPANVSPDYKP